jgi:molybdenum cofactor cytidylyltransferase
MKHDTEPLATQAKIGIVILAAGASTRMGQPKQLLLHRGQTLLRRAVETALASVCGPVVVVIGAHAELVRREVEELPVLVAENREWEKGMSSSIRTGLHELTMTNPEIEAVIVMLADQPLVTAALINQLVDVSRNTGKRIVASAYGKVLGVPALFSRELFADITALNANEGARQVIASHPDDVATVSFPEAAVDVDTPRDYELLEAGSAADLRG